MKAKALDLHDLIVLRAAHAEERAASTRHFEAQKALRSLKMRLGQKYIGQTVTCSYLFSDDLSVVVEDTSTV